MNDPKEYEKPEIVEELDLETKAGSPACQPVDPLDITKPIC